MARKDIEIRVRAKDDASRNAKKIADSLKLIGTDGKKASDSAAKMSAALSGLTADVSKLQNQADKLTSFSAIVGKMEKAGASVARLETQLTDAAKGFESVITTSKAAAAASAQLKAQIAAEDRAIDSRNAELKAAAAALKVNRDLTIELGRAQDVLNGKQRKGVSGSGNTPSLGVGIESGAPRSSARESFGAFLTADLASAEAAKNQITSTITGLKASIVSSKKVLSEYSEELTVASGREKEFSDEATRAGNAILALRTDLASARGKLTGLEEEVLATNAALGTLAFSQAEVAEAAARATEEIRKQERALSVFERFAGKKLVGGGTIADPTSAEKAKKQANAMRVATEEIAILREEQTKLDNLLRSSSGNVTAQVDAYNRMSKAVQLAEEQVRKLQIAQRLAETAGQKTGYGKWVSAYERSVASAAAATQRLDVANRKTVGSAAAISAASQRAAASKQRLAASANQASTSLLNFGRSTRTTLSFMQRLRGEVIAITTAYIGFYAAFDRVSQAANAFRAVEKAQQNLGVAFGGDTGKVRQEMAYLNAEADRLGFTFNVLANGYGKISVAAQSAGFSIADTRELFGSITEAARVSGASVDEMNGILKAFDQILSKGKIQAEELRGQLGDRMTGAFKLFADALGVTTAELDAMMKKGEVLADRDTLLKVADRLTAVYSGQLPAALASVGFAIDSFQRSIEKINLLLAEGMVDSLKDASKSLADFVASAEGQETFRAIGDAAGALISVLAEIPKYFDLIGIAATGVIAIKLGQWTTSLIGGVLALSGGVSRLGADLTLVGPRLVALSGAQSRFAAATSSANAILLTFQSRLTGMAVQSQVARLGITGLSATLGFLRTTMITVAGVASAMWTAIGGPIGIAVAAITLMYAGWASAADKATTALQEHERQVGLVLGAYSAASTGAKNWANSVNGLSIAQAIASVDALREVYADATKSLEDYSRQAVAWYADLIQAVPDDPVALQAQEVNNLAIQFRKGQIGADAFESALNDIALNPADDQLKKLALEMLNLLNTGDDTGKSIRSLDAAIKKGEALLRQMNGTATDADKVLLGLIDTTERLNDQFDKSSFVESYTEAIEELRSKIPSLADEMERLKNITELNASAWKGLVAAWNSGDFDKMLEVAALWGRGIGAQATKDALSVFDGATGSGGSSAALIKQFEGFSETPYYDVNAFRAGFGSDTVTLSDGSIQKVVEGMTVTLADAERDLARRIVEFQNVVIGQVGKDRFNSFTDQQQAVLTSIAYNYGDLPERILDAVRNGSTAEIAEAIAALGTDNAGVNSGRRSQEALIFSAGGAADVGVLVAAEQERLKIAKDQTEATRKRIADLDYEIAKNDLITAGKERQIAIEETLRAAKAENPDITPGELAIVAGKAAFAYEQEKSRELLELEKERAEATGDRLLDLDNEIAKQTLINAGKERQALIEEAIREAKADNPAISAAELDLIAQKTGALYDQQNVQTGIQLSEERVNQLYELRQQLIEQMALAQESGDFTAAATLKTEIEGLNTQLRTAIDNTIAMWAAVGGPEADVAIAKLQTMNMSLKSGEMRVGSFGLSMDTWYGAFQSAVQGIVGAFQAFSKAIATGENAFVAFGRAALQVLADVLMQIAAAIIQQQILIALQSMGGGIGGFATQMLTSMTGHTGGVVGSTAIGGGNTVGRPNWVNNALTYHSGGIAGFAPDEVNATLKVGEEVLTEQDPRHRFNQGGTSSESKGTRLKQVLAIGDDEIANAMAGAAGERVQMTTIKRNAPTIRRMLGI